MYLTFLATSIGMNPVIRDKDPRMDIVTILVQRRFITMSRWPSAHLMYAWRVADECHLPVVCMYSRQSGPTGWTGCQPFVNHYLQLTNDNRLTREAPEIKDRMCNNLLKFSIAWYWALSPHGWHCIDWSCDVVEHREEEGAGLGGGGVWLAGQGQTQALQAQHAQNIQQGKSHLDRESQWI